MRLQVRVKQPWSPMGTGLFFLLSLFYMETVLRVFSTGNWASGALWFALWFAAPPAALFTYVSRHPVAAVCRIGVISLHAVVYIYFASQLIYYQIFRTFYSSYSFLRAGQGFAFMDVILSTLAGNAIPLALLTVPAIASLLLRRALCHPIAPRSWQNAILLTAAVFTFGIATLGLTGDSPNRAKAQYFGRVIPTDAVDSIGALSYAWVDLLSHVREVPQAAGIGQLVGGIPSASESPSDSAVDFVHAETLSNPVLSSGSAGTAVSAEQVPVKPQVLSIDFDALIAQETDPVLGNLHRYFRQKTPSETNAYTGKFKDYNLIQITAEGFSHLAVHPELTPTLHRMMHGGVRFQTFYTPLWGVSTSDGEYVALLSRIPKPGVWSMATSGTTSLPFALGNQFRRLGYTTKAYHNHYYEYYGRDISHPNLGYDYKGLGLGLAVTEVWPESDLEMMELSALEYMDEPKFHTYYMTVSGHLQYNFGGNFISRKNRSLVEHLDVSETAKAYFACQIELDRAVEYLLRELRKRGIAERTVIAIIADHYPYGLPYEVIDELTGHEVDRRFELYENACILYVDGMEPIDTGKIGSSFDLLPTLSNLFGLDFDSRFFMGRDIFSDAPMLIPFVDRSWISDEGYFDSVKNQFRPSSEGVSIAPELLERRKAEVDAMFYVSEAMLDRDYFRRIETQWNR